MGLDLLTIGEALVEVMRTEVGQPLDQPGPFIGPYPSGAPFIFAVQAARLGLRVGAIGSVGADAFGDCLMKQLSADTINTDGLRVSDTQATGVAFVAYNDDGTRSFVFSLGAGGELSLDMLEPKLFADLRCLHLMGSTLSMHEAALEVGYAALQMAQSAGARFSFDPNLRPELMDIEEAREAFSPFISAADVLIPTEDELLGLTQAADLQQAIKMLISQKPDRVIIVTRGANGCSVYTQDESHHVAGFAVDEVDPTGAGDCFDAGFLAGWLGHKTLLESAHLANACGALAVTKQGPMAGAEKASAVEQFIAEQG